MYRLQVDLSLNVEVLDRRIVDNRSRAVAELEQLTRTHHCQWSSLAPAWSSFIRPGQMEQWRTKPRFTATP